MSTDHPHRYDFFLSFTGVDMTWAEWIADRLTTMEDLHGRPCRVLFQKWDFVPGSNWVDMMDRGVRLCARIVPVLSPDYLDACPYGSAEWQAAWQSDPNGAARRLVPVRVRPCDPTGLLGAIVYIDLVGHHETTAMSVLHDGMRAAVHGRRARRPPTFPSGTPLR